MRTLHILIKTISIFFISTLRGLRSYNLFYQNIKRCKVRKLRLILARHMYGFLGAGRLIKARLYFEDEDDEGEGRRESQGMEELEVEEDGEDDDELHPGRRGGSRNLFIDAECGVSKGGREDDD